MKSHKLLLAAIAIGTSMLTTGCRDNFAEVNSDPSNVVTGEISYLFAEAVNQFDTQPYLEYYYHAPLKYSWCGMGISTSGASESIFSMTELGEQASAYLDVLRVQRAIEYEIDLLDEDGQTTNSAYLAATRVLAIHMGIYATDMFGSIPWTEACYAAYGGTMTPSYDRVEDLYDLWIDELDDAIETLTSSDAYMLSSQDVVFGGDTDKWAKYANSLKLRIAVRLLAQDASTAKSIASEVESASCGYIDAIDEDVRFCKGTTALTSNTSESDYIYHWSNGFTGCAAPKSVVDLMINNRDPRVRFFYTKNYWNSTIVQGFYDAGLDIPDFIEENVVYTTDSIGKKTFVEWGGLGEPWVRYYGLVEDYDAGNDSSGDYKWYWPSNYPNAASECYLQDKYGGDYSYQVYSQLNRLLIIGRYYTNADHVEDATLPDDVYTFTTSSRPWYGMYMSAAEVNLYLAEFAMLNGNSSKAQTYYERALEFSVESYDELTEDNQVAYRASVSGCFGYDPNEGAIDLVDGEIETMMEGEQYAFTGTDSEKLEKIYLQLLLHFIPDPNECYITARRSGYPKFSSTVFERPDYSENNVYFPEYIPRRFPTGALTDDDLMKDIKKAAYEEQGITEGASASYDTNLATERLWQDKGAPDWGEGQ